MATEAGGTHPTGMHSCFSLKFCLDVVTILTNWLILFLISFSCAAVPSYSMSVKRTWNSISRASDTKRIQQGVSVFVFVRDRYTDRQTDRQTDRGRVKRQWPLPKKMPDCEIKLGTGAQEWIMCERLLCIWRVNGFVHSQFWMVASREMKIQRKQNFRIRK